MKTSGLWLTVKRLARGILLVDLVAAVAVGLVCWVVGWRTAEAYGQALLWTGMGILAFGVLAILGGWGITRTPPYLYGQTASDQPVHERAQQDIKDSSGGFAFSAQAAVAALVLAGLGLLVPALF